MAGTFPATTILPSQAAAQSGLRQITASTLPATGEPAKALAVRCSLVSRLTATIRTVSTSTPPDQANLYSTGRCAAETDAIAGLAVAATPGSMPTAQA